jgi:predicted flap endonuclease-1-like 5' DNA nuclease
MDSGIIFEIYNENQEEYMASIVDVEGIGKTYATKLQAAGVNTTDALLEMGASPKGRKLLSEKTGVSEKLILEWVNHVDLYRIKGVGSEYADLLEEAGVDTVVELAARVPENLHKAMLASNQKKDLVRKMPALSQVTEWVAQAKKLPRVVSY